MQRPVALLQQRTDGTELARPPTADRHTDERRDRDHAAPGARQEDLVGAEQFFDGQSVEIVPRYTREREEQHIFVKIGAGQFVFLTDGLQLILAVALMSLAVMVTFHCFRKLVEKPESKVRAKSSPLGTAEN